MSFSLQNLIPFNNILVRKGAPRFLILSSSCLYNILSPYSPFSQHLPSSPLGCTHVTPMLIRGDGMSHQLTWLSNLPSLFLLKYIGLYICSSPTGVSNKEDFHWGQLMAYLLFFSTPLLPPLPLSFCHLPTFPLNHFCLDLLTRMPRQLKCMHFRLYRNYPKPAVLSMKWFVHWTLHVYIAPLSGTL